MVIRRSSDGHQGIIRWSLGRDPDAISTRSRRDLGAISARSRHLLVQLERDEPRRHRRRRRYRGDDATRLDLGGKLIDFINRVVSRAKVTER